MYCTACRQERGGASIQCVVCGGFLTLREREEIEQERGHVRYLLSQIDGWEVPSHVKAAIRGRYERLDRVLVEALGPSEIVEARPVEIPAAAPQAEPGHAERSEAESKHQNAAGSVGDAKPAVENAVPIETLRDSGPSTAPQSGSAQGDREAAASSEPKTEPPAEPIVEALPVHSPDPRLPVFEPPPVRTHARKAVEEVSRWQTVWKPFLYESIGWFLGAVLILAGTFYFVAESWAGLTSIARALVVFGFAAAYSSAFGIAGRFLGKKPRLAAAGSALATIGAAVAPLAAVALTPMAKDAPGLLAGLAVFWAVAVGMLSRAPARSLLPSAPHALFASAGAAAFATGVAPLLTNGRLAIGLALLPVALLLAAKEESAEQRTGWVIAAAAYGVALTCVRLQVALPISIGAWAPAAALFLACALRLAPRKSGSVELVVIAVQLALVAVAFESNLWAAFVASAVLAWTAARITARSGDARWDHVACAAAIAAVGPLPVLLGHPDDPFHAGLLAIALAVVLLALVGAGLIGSSLEPRARVWLRFASVTALACAAVLTSAANEPSSQLAVGALTVVLLGTGLWRGEAVAMHCGSALAALSPLFVRRFDPLPRAAVLGGLSLGLTAIATRSSAALRKGPALATFVVSLAAAAWLVGGGRVPFAIGAGSGAVALIWLGIALELEVAILAGGVVVALLFGKLLPTPVSISLGIAGVLLAGAGRVDARFRTWRTLGALCAIAGVGWGSFGQLFSNSKALGPELLLAAAACAVAGGALEVVGAFFLAAATLPGLRDLPFCAWASLRPEHALCLQAALGTGAAAAFVVGWKGPSLRVLTSALLVFASVVLCVSPPGLGWLAAAWLGVAATCALTPAVAIVWLSSIGIFYGAQHGTVACALESVALALLGCVDLLPRLRERLWGRRSAGLAASLGSFALLLFAVQTPAPLWLAALACALTLVWLRASGEGLFAAAGPLLACNLAFVSSLPHAHWLGLAFAVALSRALHHLPAVRRALGLADSRTAEPATLWGAFLVEAAFTAAHPSTAAEWALLALLALGASPQLDLRLLAMAAVSVFLPPTPVPVAVLGALAVALRLWPELTARLLGGTANENTPRVATIAALLVALVHAGLAPTSVSLVTLGLALGLGAWLLALEPLLSAACVVLCAAPLGTARLDLFASLSPTTEAIALGLALLFAGGAAGLRARTEDIARSLWDGAALSLAGLIALIFVGHGVPAERLATGLALVTALVLLSADTPWRIFAAVGLAGASSILAVPLVHASSALSLVAVALGLAAFLREEGDQAQFDAASVLALMAIGFVPSLGSNAVVWCATAIAVLAWARVVRQPGFEPYAWWVSAFAGHAVLLHVGIVFSTGRPAQYVLPYAGALSAALASVALARTSRPQGRAGVGLAALAILELLGGGLLIVGPARPEALIGAASAVVLVVMLVRWAVANADELAAYFAQGALLVGYVVLRQVGSGERLGQADAIAWLVGGALFSGLFAWTQRQTDGREVLAGPSRLGAYLLPLVGLLFVAGTNRVTALLLVGTAAHYAALATRSDERKLASILASIAFNLALLVAWRLSDGGELEFYAIPAGLSLLALVRVFRDDLDPDSEAKLRAVAITVVYAAGAWRPLMFPETWAFFLCIVLCLVGVAAGIALRIRSYVYLGSAFLVTSVVANLVRYGARDHRLGAAFLSLLGLLVVGGMIVFSAKREELVRRYDRMRELLASWDS